MRQRSAPRACAASKRTASEETAERTAAGDGVCFSSGVHGPGAASRTPAAHRLPSSAAGPPRCDC
jgi:hypothetical protein